MVKPGEALIVDLADLSDGDRRDGDGAIWSIPHGGDLDANLVRLAAGSSIGEHRNDEVDVLLVMRSGDGRVSINGAAGAIGSSHVVLIPRGAIRSVAAGPEGMTYLSIHRRRGGISIQQPSRSDG